MPANSVSLILDFFKSKGLEAKHDVSEDLPYVTFYIDKDQGSKWLSTAIQFVEANPDYQYRYSNSLDYTHLTILL